MCEDGPCSCESSAPDGLGAVLRRALEDARDRYAAARRALAATGDATAAAAVVEEAERLEREEAEREEAERLEREASEAEKFETEVSERLVALARDSSKAPRCEDSGDCGYFEQCINSRCVGATSDEEQIETRSFAAAVAWAQRKQASSPYRRWLTSRDVRKTDAAGGQWETASELNRMTSLLRRQLQGGVYSYFYFPWDLGFSEPTQAPSRPTPSPSSPSPSSMPTPTPTLSAIPTLSAKPSPSPSTAAPTNAKADPTMNPTYEPTSQPQENIPCTATIESGIPEDKVWEWGQDVELRIKMCHWYSYSDTFVDVLLYGDVAGADPVDSLAQYHEIHADILTINYTVPQCTDYDLATGACKTTV